MRRLSGVTRTAAALLSVAAVSFAGILGGPSAHAAANAGTVTVHMSTSGSDGNDGTAAAPVRSLARVKQILAGTETESATVLVAPGTYYESAMVSWNGIPQTTLAFRRSSATQRPVFDGSRATGTSHYWMNTAGGPSLDVRELLVRNYRTGGIRIDTDGNTVRNMIFEKLGNSYVANGPGYAALHLLGASGNTLTNNIFRNLENTDCPGCIHAIYAANGSSDNHVNDSTFTTITGDPVRLRHDTHDNIVERNSFATSGSAATDRAMVSFWRFTSAEICGTGNRVDDNTYNGRYYNGSTGQQIFGSGAEPGLARCATAISGSGNTLVSG